MLSLDLKEVVAQASLSDLVGAERVHCGWGGWGGEMLGGVYTYANTTATSRFFCVALVLCGSAARLKNSAGGMLGQLHVSGSCSGHMMTT